MKTMLIAVVLLLIGAGGAVLYLSISEPTRGEAEAAQAGFCAEHSIAESDCPWCDPSLIKTKGHCAGHDVPEALCSRCNPALIPGFKAEKDWCAGHGVPESQCLLCKKGGNTDCASCAAGTCEAGCGQ